MSKARKLADLGNQVDDGAITGSNMVANGGMTVAQRGAGPFTNASGGYQTVDRFQLSGTMGGSFTLEQVSDAPSGSGFDKSFKALAPTGFSSPTAAASAKIATSIEAQNLQHLMYGSSNAVTVTVSFWVKATVTGTYIFELYGDDSNRTISTAYTISTSNTWEKKIITIDGDVSGTINNDNGSGLTAQWWIGAGSNFTSGTLQTAWGSYTAANRAVGQVNSVASNNDAFYLTGVCLNVGDSAIDFPHESYGETLAKCQRYFESIETSYKNSSSGYFTNHGNGAWVGPQFNFKVTKRATPSIISDLATFSWRRASFRNSSATTIGTGASTTQGITTDSFVVSIAESGISNGTTALLFSNAGYFYTADAEL